ncbi:MAG: DUF6634 family protein [Pseudomonadota bacterium]
MTIWIDRNGPHRNIEREIEKTEALLADLRRFANKQFPTSLEIGGAPLIDDYKINLRTCPVLSGIAHNHPRLGTTDITTTELWAIAPTLGWARTWSRFYRLGFPSDQFDDEAS